MDKQYTPMTDQYFATLPVDELLPELERKVTDYGDFILRSGKLTQWRTNWEMYNRSELKIGVRYGGDRGQYKLIESNIFRSILTGLVSVICSQRPTFQPESVNDDHRSMSQDIIFDSVSNYYLKVKKLEDYYKTGTMIGLLFGECWLFQHWDANVGEVIDVVNDPQNPGQQQPIKEGDAQFDIIYPMDMIRDYTRMDMNNDWYIIRQYLNKWDLIAQRPDLKDDLMGLTITTDLQRYRFGHILDSQTSNMELIPVYTFTHRKTAACPQGRFVQYIDSKVYTLDTPQPYDEITVYPMCPDVQPMQNFGSTIMTALVKLQYAYDKALSIILTNQQAFAIQNIVVDNATQTKPEQVIEGLNFIRTNLSNGIPQALQLCKTPEEVFTFLTLMETQMEKLSGLPSILRGTPPTGVESGTAMAFLQAQALVFNSPIQQAYISFLERSATGLFNILKSFATSKRMLAIAGTSKAQYISEFSGKDLENITRVIVQAGNPSAQTEAGRMQMAQNLIAQGMIDKKEFFAIMETGTLDTAIEGPEAENMYIAEENELLRQGKQCVVSPGDNHELHMQQHNTLFFDTQLRMQPDNPVLVNTQTHMLNHAAIIIPGCTGPTDPRYLAVLGIQVSMPPAPPPGAQQQPTPHPIANPLPAGVKPTGGTATTGNNPTPVRTPVLNKATPPQTAQAAAHMGNAHMPGAK